MSYNTKVNEFLGRLQKAKTREEVKKISDELRGFIDSSSELRMLKERRQQNIQNKMDGELSVHEKTVRSVEREIGQTVATSKTESQSCV